MDDLIKKTLLDSASKIAKATDGIKIPTSALQMMEDFNSISKSYEPSIADMQIPIPPTQYEINEYQSASALMEALSDEALRWKKELPDEFQPAIIAILQGGVQIHVHRLSQVSFHGIKIEGTLNDAPCSLLSHQSTVQMLCYGDKKSEEKTKNPIGFIWPGHAIEI